ncbi:BTAD domain-containing putative transcriptional regulator [Streptomyces sp. WAC06614]|uniref:AfsR/SARP family transcriptional regulator n=1 Tax=Streptomyces sp. WAC06614 TaxID=2487416 RepID=UPI000F77A6E4|nr:BTAD domain-containing putative transcriptional regulator [Streptomyces sp. WAC06614]RSS83739.1 hypothetical protein EF918_02735 [Streptomyces sp. WAC06614]
MLIRLLGPVELAGSDGAPVEVAGANRRAVLAILALEFGRTVPVERFCELLWGEEPPARSKAALQGHVAALRKALDGSSLQVVTRPQGYVLTGDAESVDAHRFAALVARAEAEPDRAGAAALLDQALGLWHGSALAGTPDTDLRRSLASQLDTARTQALAAWAERLLDLGSGSAAVPALERAVRDDGLQEPLAALLIRCLDQAGRGSEAAAVYHRVRTRLDEELGITPGRVLQAAFASVGAGPADRSAAPAAPPSTVAAALPHAFPTPAAPPSASAVAAAPPSAAAAVSPRAVAAAPSSAFSFPAASPSSSAGAAAVPPEVPGGPGAPGVPAVPGARAPLPAGPAGRMLPRRPPGFVGREAESALLDAECGPERTGGGLAVVVGPAGVGKTATVVRWAHSRAAGFPDGQLFVDLRGFDPAGPADPAEALEKFLRALGVPPTAVPQDPAGRAALYRELTRHKSLLVVLDNARSAAEVTALLPSGTRCATVVTSRNTLEDLLVTDGAVVVRLGTLPPGEARQLLERLLTPARVAAEPEASERLAALCGRLPLALRIAAARIAARPDWTIGQLVDELADERTRLQALDTQGSVSVRTTLTLTHPHLDGTAVRLLPLLTLHPGPEIDAFSAAALLGSSAADARRALDSLAAYHLLDEGTPGRYSHHELIRLHGTELLTERPMAERRRAAAGLLEYALATADRAAALLQPQVRPLERRTGGQPQELPPLTDVRSTLAWFDGEEPVIRGVVLAAAEQGRHVPAWQLAHSADALYRSSGRPAHGLECLRAGLEAALRTGDRTATARLEALTARALCATGRPQEALPPAIRAAEGTGPQDGDAHVLALSVLVRVLTGLGRLAQAEQVARTARALVGDPRPTGHAVCVLAAAAELDLRSGRADQALRHARQCQDLLADRPEVPARLLALETEARALHLLGRGAEAEARWTEALAGCESAGVPALRALVERRLGAFLAESGRFVEAAGHLSRAAEWYGRTGSAQGSA